MKNKLITLLLVITGAALIGFYFIKGDAPPQFTLSKAIQLTPVQASTFDYSQVNNTQEKKSIFFDTLRPIIRNQNQVIQDTRARILFAKEHQVDQQWLSDTAEKYKVEWDINNPDWETLLRHVDTIPIELAMAQAANESAWGQSRFAQKGNNLFGQWCFSKGCGIVPSQRDSGTKHEVKKFKSINHSVTSYMLNINTTRAYKQLRELRADLRENNKPLSAALLATGLEKYSSRGKAYVKEIQSMIKTNYHLIHDIDPLNANSDTKKETSL